MSNTLIKSASSWTAACPGASISSASATRVLMPGEFLAQGTASLLRQRDWYGTNPCDQRFEQRIQDDQGRSVFEHLLEDMSVPAPATAHVGVTVKGGVSGPYPWRRPV
ncbi:hypothetical protein [Spirillospora sp. CA-128828]|uniref:hypothetical protein n=1 Tax=Spirillospora sp. CA-128828 TaxID=3240033 RepID=UPI003D8C3838